MHADKLAMKPLSSRDELFDAVAQHAWTCYRHTHTANGILRSDAGRRYPYGVQHSKLSCSGNASYM